MANLFSFSLISDALCSKTKLNLTNANVCFHSQRGHCPPSGNVLEAISILHFTKTQQLEML